MKNSTAVQDAFTHLNSRFLPVLSWLTPMPADVTPLERRSYNMMIVGQPTTLTVHFLLIFLFAYWGIPALALVNVFSVLLWLLSIIMLRRHRLALSLAIGAIEVVIHTVLVVYFVGWGMGIQYYLIPMMLGASVSVWPLWSRISTMLVSTVVFILLYYYALGNPSQAVIDPFQLNLANVIVTFSAFALSAAMMLYGVSIADKLEAQLETEYEKSETLLCNVLPEVIVARLKNNQGTIADPRQTKSEGIAESFTDVSVLFADVVGFTPLSERLTPQESVDLLNDVFTHFDMLAKKYGVEKIRTIGDGYMVAAGAPLPRVDHAQALGRMALDMQQYMKSREQTADAPLQVRIGINSGPAVAGIIGTTKFHYDLWGDMVNTASRMESHGRPGKIQIARPTYELIQDEFQCEPQGTVDVKGKGEMDVWFITAGRDELQNKVA